MTAAIMDPFGAPEWFTTGVHREMVSADLMRLTFFCEEGDPPERIVRCRVYMPMETIRRERAIFLHEVSTIDKVKVA